MKSTVCWRNSFFSVGMIFFSLLFIVACGSGGWGEPHKGTAPTITSTNSVTFYEEVAGTFTVTATGDPTPTFSLTGTLPLGVTFDNSTGILSGIPSASGVYTLTIIATNGVSPDATQSFTLIVDHPLVLIVTGSDPYSNVVPNLTSIMNNAGLSVNTSVNVPASPLSGYSQIWDIRWQGSTPLTAGDIANYTTYLQGGGTLVLIGENKDSNAARNDSIVSLISSLGGGSITVFDSSSDQTVQPPFNTPNPVTTVPFSFISPAYTADPGTGAFITKDSSNNGSAIYYARGMLSVADTGRLMVVFDVNWMEGTRGPEFQSLIDNMVRLP